MTRSRVPGVRGTRSRPDFGYLSWSFGVLGFVLLDMVALYTQIIEAFMACNTTRAYGFHRGPPLVNRVLPSYGDRLDGKLKVSKLLMRPN